MLCNEMPHGGFKRSGYGKDLSMYALEDYTVGAPRHGEALSEEHRSDSIDGLSEGSRYSCRQVRPDAISRKCIGGGAVLRRPGRVEKEVVNGERVGSLALAKGRPELHITLDPSHQATAHNVAHLMVDETAAATSLRKQRHQDHQGIARRGIRNRGFVFADPDGNQR